MPLLEPIDRTFIDNGDGWDLEVRRYRHAEAHRPGRRPVLMIPGYAMNTFILAYHPGGASMVEHLIRQGFDVWTANLRGQGASRCRRSGSRFGLAELALTDLAAVLQHVRRTTGAADVDVVGCSLGASLVYTWLAHHPDDHHVGSVIAIGGPLRWDAVHPLLRVAFTSGRLAGAVRLKGTRQLARAALPVLRRFPPLLSVYMNVSEIDLDAADDLVQVVEDPVPWINRQVARWIRDRALIVRGVDVAAALGRVRTPLLVVLANADGIVPPAAALSAVAAIGTRDATVLTVGTPERWYAHADLFIGPRAQEEVFTPMADWLARREAPDAQP